jgi:hypothetical protein
LEEVIAYGRNCALGEKTAILPADNRRFGDQADKAILVEEEKRWVSR